MPAAKTAKPVVLTAEQIAALHLMDAHVGSAKAALEQVTTLAHNAVEQGVPIAQVLAAAGHIELARLVDFIGDLKENE
jgi:hypothetical protein